MFGLGYEPSKFACHMTILVQIEGWGSYISYIYPLGAYSLTILVCFAVFPIVKIKILINRF